MESVNESSNNEPLTVVPKVAIIGAGPSGIVSARHLKEVADITIYESKSELGGLWLYNDFSERNNPDIQSDQFYKLYGCMHESIYYDLISNLPKQYMTFKDFPHDESAPYLLPRDDFQKYLLNYADHFDIRKYIKFNTTVTDLKVDEESDNRYKLSYISSTSQDEEPVHQNENFDYVIVGNGHFSRAYEPDFEGKDTFTGTQFHSHNFRRFYDNDFKDKNVLIVGVKSSGTDLISHIFFDKETKDTINPNKVFVTANNVSSLQNSQLYAEIVSEGKLEVKSGGITKIDQDSVYFGDGSDEKIDTIIYATGYYYSLPFIDPKNGIIEWDACSSSESESQCREGFYFGPLYK